MSKQSSTESGPSNISSNRLSRQSSSETTMGAPAPARGIISDGRDGGGGNNPYQSWHGTPRTDHQPRRSTGNVSELNSLPRQRHQQHRRSMTCNNESAIPLIEYSMTGPGRAGSGNPLLIDNGEMDQPVNERHYSTLDRASGGGQRGVDFSDNRRTYNDNANHIGGGRLGNHIDSSHSAEAAEAEDYYPDDTAHEPQRGRQGQLPMTPRGGGRGGHDPRGMDPGGGGYIKYNSFANY